MRPKGHEFGNPVRRKHQQRKRRRLEKAYLNKQKPKPKLNHQVITCTYRGWKVSTCNSWPPATRWRTPIDGKGDMSLYVEGVDKYHSAISKKNIQLLIDRLIELKGLVHD